MTQSVLYTDTDKIRSVLGIEEVEMTDPRLTARGIDKELKLDLVSWIADHEARYLAGTAVGASSSQVAIADALVLYSTYFCSVLTAQSLKLGAAQAITDGKNSMQRFSAIDWQALLIHLKERLSFYKALLQELTVSASVTPTTYNLFTVVGSAVDPVTQAE